MQHPSQSLLQDIATRFILTAPSEQLESCEHMMFLVEQAWWYYEDHVRLKDPSLRSYCLKEFAAVLFTGCSDLLPFRNKLEEIMDRYKNYKSFIPVMGAILLDYTLQSVLLVKGWSKGACWGFPKGKINRNENEADCAVREVAEETGIDIEHLIRHEDYIELVLDGKRTRLYIVPGLDPDTLQFAPKCRGEISGYAWHNIADLPCTKEQGAMTYTSTDGTRYRFYAVWPFMKRLKQWIKKYKGTSKAMRAAPMLPLGSSSGGSQSSASDTQDYFPPSLLSPHSPSSSSCAPAARKPLSEFTFDMDSIMAAMQNPEGQLQ